MQTYYTFQQVEQLVQQNQMNDAIDLALSLLPQAAECAVVPVSHFKVGAIAIDDKGNFYFGANQECAEAAMAQTVHAEQSAVSHAWSRGATRLAHIVVNYTPCGHCRQFLNELRDADKLLIHLPHARNNRLHDYLPDSFGPADLAIEERLLDTINHDFRLPENVDSSDLLQAALTAMNRSYAPYSQAFAGVALQLASGEIFSGSYAENAAYNPSFPPLQMAINVLRMAGFEVNDVVAAALVCVKPNHHTAHTLALWQQLSAVAMQIVEL